SHEGRSLPPEVLGVGAGCAAAGTRLRGPVLAGPPRAGRGDAGALRLSSPHQPHPPQPDPPRNVVGLQSPARELRGATGRRPLSQFARRAAPAVRLPGGSPATPRPGTGP